MKRFDIVMKIDTFATWCYVSSSLLHRFLSSLYSLFDPATIGVVRTLAAVPDLRAATRAAELVVQGFLTANLADTFSYFGLAITMVLHGPYITLGAKFTWNILETQMAQLANSR